MNGQTATLNRFILKSTDQCVPFFKALKGRNKVEWDEECEQAFQALKKYLASPEVLTN
ncbi:hypothetical protein ['Camptotheca acuminata' phytoplasma]|uniref:hypothetical protein n=1 Tax='Camptotheca acuminata' phytoplasma TaxID=3239192 RepID=UPI003519E3C9